MLPLDRFVSCQNKHALSCDKGSHLNVHIIYHKDFLFDDEWWVLFVSTSLCTFIFHPKTLTSADSKRLFFRIIIHNIIGFKGDMCFLWFSVIYIQLWCQISILKMFQNLRLTYTEMLPASQKSGLQPAVNTLFAMVFFYLTDELTLDRSACP